MTKSTELLVTCWWKVAGTCKLLNHCQGVRKLSRHHESQIMQLVGDRTSVGRIGFSLKWSVQEELEVVGILTFIEVFFKSGGVLFILVFIYLLLRSRICREQPLYLHKVRGKAVYIVHTTSPNFTCGTTLGMLLLLYVSRITSANFV